MMYRKDCAVTITKLGKYPDAVKWQNLLNHYLPDETLIPLTVDAWGLTLQGFMHTDLLPHRDEIIEELSSKNSIRALSGEAGIWETKSGIEIYIIE